MHFQDGLTSFPTEILLEITKLVNPGDLLALQATSRKFRQICLIKSLWIHQAEEQLKSRPLHLPMSVTLETATIEELRFATIRSEKLRHAWKTSSKDPLIPFRAGRARPELDNTDATIGFLRTGEHIFIMIFTKVWLLHLETDEFMWEHDFGVPYGEVCWDCEETSRNSFRCVFVIQSESLTVFDTQKVVVMDMTFADDGTVNVEEISQHSLDCDFSGMWTANGHYGLLVSNPSRQLSMLVAKTDTHEFAMLDIGVAATPQTDAIVTQSSVILHWILQGEEHTLTYELSRIFALEFALVPIGELQATTIPRLSSTKTKYEFVDPGAPDLAQDLLIDNEDQAVTFIRDSWHPTGMGPFPILTMYGGFDKDMQPVIRLCHHFYDPEAPPEVVRPMVLDVMNDFSPCVAPGLYSKEVFWLKISSDASVELLFASTPLGAEEAVDGGACIIRSVALSVSNLADVISASYDDSTGTLVVLTLGCIHEYTPPAMSQRTVGVAGAGEKSM